MESKSVEILAKRRAFLQASDDLSADFIIQESLRAFNETRFLEKIEEALISKNKEMFNHYTELLNDVKN